MVTLLSIKLLEISILLTKSPEEQNIIGANININTAKNKINFLIIHIYNATYKNKQNSFNLGVVFGKKV